MLRNFRLVVYQIVGYTPKRRFSEMIAHLPSYGPVQSNSSVCVVCSLRATLPPIPTAPLTAILDPVMKISDLLLGAM